MTILTLTMLILIAIAILWRQNKEYIIAKYRYKLFAFRDRLRLLYITDPESLPIEDFRKLDKSVTYLLQYVKEVTLYEFLFNFYLHQKYKRTSNPIMSDKGKRLLNELVNIYLTSLIKKSTLTFLVFKVSSYPVGLLSILFTQIGKWKVALKDFSTTSVLQQEPSVCLC